MTIDEICALTTVVIPTSPRPLHPSTAIIDEVLASIRYWLPTAPIRILCDGIRPEFESRRGAYGEFLHRLMESVPENTELVIHSSHRHQAAMVKELLPDIATPLVFWSEDDMVMFTDRPIEWAAMADAILTGSSNLCRLMLTERVHPEHEYLYGGYLNGYPLRRQRQWSGWTHLASVELYRRLLRDFNPQARMMVERYVARFMDTPSWETWKLTSYVPDPDHAARLIHRDGRDRGDGTKDPSYEEAEIYPPR